MEDQLLEMDSQTERLRLKFQRELSEKISIYIRKLLDMEKSQNTILRKELARLRSYLGNQPNCNCRPVVCRICDKFLKNRHTLKQQQRTIHHMSRREPWSFENQTTTDLEYQFPNYQENGNGNTWGPPLHLHNYTSVVNTSVPE